jgi:hypothetical protein
LFNQLFIVSALAGKSENKTCLSICSEEMVAYQRIVTLTLNRICQESKNIRHMLLQIGQLMNFFISLRRHKTTAVTANKLQNNINWNN